MILAPRDVADADRLKALLAPYSAEGMTMWPAR
jgi:hypothetical protein